MNNIYRTLLLAGCMAASGWGQVPKSQAYVFQGFGTSLFDYDAAMAHTGVGGEGVFFKGLGAGADIGAAYPLRYPQGVVGQLNVSGYYHFTAGRKDTKWDPFVVAGYTMFFRSGVAHAAHYGGGVTYWMKERVGLRAEFRNHQLRYDGAHFGEFRIGVSFH